MPASLDLALVGNGGIGALINPQAEVVWMCLPRFDGDPVFCSLLRGPEQSQHDGAFAIEMMDSVRSEQRYLDDTPILVTRFFDAKGASIQITDFGPRFERNGRIIAPRLLVRKIERVSGDPLVRIRVRPMEGYGASRLELPQREGSIERAADPEGVRYTGKDAELRLLTDAPLQAIEDETPFALDREVTIIVGDDATPPGTPAGIGTEYLKLTSDWWHAWVRALTVPAEWREPVVRAAITLKLNVVEETGAIIAAVTTSIPESADSGRNWDYRYCWLRDSYFVVNALRRLGDPSTNERYVGFLLGLLPAAGKSMRLKPMYSITGAPIPDERDEPHLDGYRGMGPVRVGNQAYQQLQHDVYGEAILAAREQPIYHAHKGLDAIEAFKNLEKVGAKAFSVHDKPDAGLWELRGIQRVHTFSSVMCWAACDALVDVAEQLGLTDRAKHWRAQADKIRDAIHRRSWNAKLRAFTAAMDGNSLDAALLLMNQLGFIAADDPRFVGTVRAIGSDLRRGDYIYRYVEKDDFGEPENAFLVCTFWYVDALAAIGDHAEARRLFENALSCRNRHGLLAEHIDPVTREQWGNFVQTYSMAGIIDSALRLAARQS